MNRRVVVLIVLGLLAVSCRLTPVTEEALIRIDGAADCGASGQWAMESIESPEAQGAPTQREALLEYLDPARLEFGGTVVTVNESVASLVIDGREQLVAFASELAGGGWTVLSAEGCEGFER